MENGKRLLRPVALCGVTMCVLCSCGRSSVEPETMYQVATLQSLMDGNYDGYLSVGDLRAKGDIGLGTFSAADGEMIVLDGRVWQARFDGSVREAEDSLGTPFANVTHFDEDFAAPLGGIDSMAALTGSLDDVVASHGRNRIYVARIDLNDCDRILVRSALPQHKPYRPLAEALATDQREFSYEHIGGSIVAVYFPSFFDGQNAVGWHCHFISKDRRYGGHMLDIAFSEQTRARFDITPYFLMYLPED